jgi:UDP-N-acetylglucosamine 4,6-dehydratase
VKVSEDFIYASDSNPTWMTEADLQAWIDENDDRIGEI